MRCAVSAAFPKTTGEEIGTSPTGVTDPATTLPTFSGTVTGLAAPPLPVPLGVFSIKTSSNFFFLSDVAGEEDIVKLLDPFLTNGGIMGDATTGNSVGVTGKTGTLELDIGGA
jgi:hypothetical protein